MDDGRAETKARMYSPESPTGFPGNKGAASRDGDAFTDPCSNGPRFAKKGFLMMPPEKKLKHFTNRAQDSEDNQQFSHDVESHQRSLEEERKVSERLVSIHFQEIKLKFDACIQDLVRCVALTSIVYGERHLKLAQSHARLAKAYLQFKGWGLQAQEHLAKARDLLPFYSSCRDEKLDVLSCLLDVNLTQGAASLLTDNLEEADSSLLKAEQIMEELYQKDAVDQEEKIKTHLEITSGLFRVYKRQRRSEEALNQCEKSLQLLKDCNQPEKTCAVYKDMAAIEQDRGHLDRAITHLSKAHAIAMSHNPEGLQGAQISHGLAMILSAAPEPHHNVDAAGQYFEQSLSAYKNSVGLQDPAFLSAQDDFCRFLLSNGQWERCVEIQRASLDSKRSVFGDLSAEVADALQLIGSVEMTEGQMSQAHRSMTKCLKIQSSLYGPQHKKTRAVQKAVNVLARTAEVVERQQRQARRKKKSDKFTTVPSSSRNNENSMSES